MLQLSKLVDESLQEASDQKRLTNLVDQRRLAAMAHQKQPGVQLINITHALNEADLLLLP